MRITTVIPAYKPDYLDELLIGLGNQTVKPERIIFSDDSPQRVFRSKLSSEPLRSSIAGMNIEVVDGPRTGAYNNCVSVLNVWRGATELVHMLLDDDVIYPTFYERHLQAHAQLGCSCSISKRWTAIATGQPVSQLPEPAVVTAHPNRMVSVDADFAFASTVPYCNNWFGETSNSVFNRDVSHLFASGRLEGISFEGLGDIGFFLSVSRQKSLGFLNEPLSFFRMNAGQTSQQPTSPAGKMGYLAWIPLAIAGKRIGKLQQAQAIQCFERIGPFIERLYTGLQDMEPFCRMLPALIAGRQDSEEIFLEAWERFLTNVRAG